MACAIDEVGVRADNSPSFMPSQEVKLRCARDDHVELYALETLDTNIEYKKSIYILVMKKEFHSENRLQWRDFGLAIILCIFMRQGHPIHPFYWTEIPMVMSMDVMVDVHW